MSVSSAPSSPAAQRIPLAGWLLSSLGKKTIVAVTGIGLVLFVIGHLLGNTTVFFGPDAINTYAEKLRDLGPLLWAARIGLLIAVGLHIYFTMLLWAENRAARPQKYAVFAPMKTTVFARTMRLTGLFVLAFVVFHLAHFTWGVVQPGYYHLEDAQGRHNVYAMVVHGFRNPWISGFYLLGLFFLTWHLSHGLGSLFQTLGITNKTLRPLYETVAKTVAWLLFLGYASIPVSILIFGLGRGIVK